MMDTLEIKKKLNSLGLAREEVNILLYLAKNGDSKVADISVALKIPRSSIYRFIDLLEKKGLIRKILSTQGNSIAISNLDNLKNQLEDRKDLLDKQISEFSNLTTSILSLKKLKQTFPEVSYYENKEGIRQIIWNTLKASDTIRVYTNAIRKDIIGVKYLENYCLEFVRNNLREKVLGDEAYSKDSYQKFGGREKYYAPIKEYFEKSDERVLKVPFLKIKGEIYIYDDVFAFYTWESNKLVGVEVKSEFLSITQSSIFDVLWGMTSKKDSIDFILNNDK